jgi:general secretion pathway protein B
MSFILDALKKAEAERQRQTGPTLLEVRVTQPRRRLPLWAVFIGALLAINILLLIVFAMRRPATSSAALSVPSVAAAAGAAPALPVAAAPAAAIAPAVAAPVVAAPPVQVPAVAAPAAAPILAPPSAAAAAAAAAAVAASENPADYEPALPANNATSSRNEPPSLSEIGGDLPDLRLDLHVYATHPADRYALINMHRVREGDVLPEGPRVVAIDRDGVELSYHGTEFMLHPQ